LTAFWCRRRRLAAVSTYEKPMEKSVCMIMKINTDNKKKKIITIPTIDLTV